MFGQHEESDRLPDRGADREQTVIGQDKQSMRAEGRGEAGADHQIDDVELLAAEDRLSPWNAHASWLVARSGRTSAANGEPYPVCA